MSPFRDLDDSSSLLYAFFLHEGANSMFEKDTGILIGCGFFISSKSLLSPCPLMMDRQPSGPCLDLHLWQFSMKAAVCCFWVSDSSL
jgi:hypothetical protein